MVHEISRKIRVVLLTCFVTFRMQHTYRNFYNSLGARVQEGLITSRFAGQTLDKVAELPLVDSEMAL